MSINISAGGLYSGSGSSSSNFLGINLSDYACIKSGSYGKLMKAYYAKNKSSSSGTSKSGNTSDVVDRILEEKKNPKVSKETQKANENLTAGLSSLKNSVSALQNDKTYTDTENGQSAADKTVSAMKSFVSVYNNVVTAAKDSTLTNKTAYVANMMRITATNADKLSEIGVTVDSDGTIRLNEDKLKAAGVSKVQELFSSKDIMSYGSMVASRLQYAGTSSSTGASTSTDTTNTSVSSALSLKADCEALASDSLYEKVKDKDGNATDKYDVGNIFAKAKSFVGNYNGMLNAAESSSNSGVLSNLSYIKEKTAKAADVLKQFGISVDEKGRMKIDEDTFKNSDMSKVQSFFKDYGSSVAVNASLVNYYMTTQANAGSGYTSDGTYNAQGSSGYTDTI